MSSEDYAKSKQGARRKQFKSKIETDDARRKREESAVVLRKNKRMESFAKRRNYIEEPEPNNNNNHNNMGYARVGAVDRQAEINNLANAVKTGDPGAQYDATSALRRLLSLGFNPPIQEVVEAKVVPYFVSFLKRSEQPLIQFEAAWALTNICSGTPEHTRYVIQEGAVLPLKDLVASPAEEAREQAIWALGNIAGDSPECRDYVLGHGVLPAVLLNLESPRISTLRNATWAISNFCRGKPQPAWEIVSPVLPSLCKLIYSSDQEVLADACWALSYLSDGPTERIQAVLDMDILPRVVELLLHQNHNVQSPALRIVGNVVTGDDLQTQKALDVGLVKQLTHLVNHTKKTIKKEAVWTVSNVTAGNKTQIQQVIDANIFPTLIAYAKSSDFEVKREAAWALSNATASGTTDQIRYLVTEGIIEPMCSLLASSDTRMIQVALDAIENILKSGEKELKEQRGATANPYTSHIESCRGLDNLENLQSHNNSTIYEKVVGILETYFAAEEDQTVAPNISGNSYQFNSGGSGGVSAAAFDF